MASKPLQYNPNFCPKKAYALILECASLASQDTLNKTLISQKFIELVKLVNSSVYDQTLLNNLIVENHMLHIEQSKHRAMGSRVPSA